LSLNLNNTALKKQQAFKHNQSTQNKTLQPLGHLFTINIPNRLKNSFQKNMLTYVLN